MPVVSSPSPVRGSPAHRAVLGAFVALGSVVGSWGARIPDVKSDLDLSDGALGSALLCLSIGAVAGAWAGGALVRRTGTRRTVVAGWVVVGALLSGPGLVSSWAALTGVALILGIAIGVLDVSMNGAGVQLEHRAGEPLLSRLHAGWSAGGLIGALVGAGAVAVGLSVAAHLGLVGAVILVAGLVWGRHTPDGRLAPHGAGSSPAVGSTRPRRLVALAGIGGCVFLAEGALVDWSGVLVRDVLEGRAVTGALAVTGLSAGGLAGRLVGDALSVRWGAPLLVRRGVLVATAALAAALVVPRPWPVPLLLTAVGAGLAPAIPLAFAAAGRAWGEHGIAVVTTAGYGSYLAGPALIGALSDGFGLRRALLVPLVLVAAVAGLAGATRGETVSREPPHPEPT